MNDDARSVRADAKAEKARAKAMRPFYKKKRWWLAGVIVLIVIIAIASGSKKKNTTTPSATATTVTQSNSTATSPPAAATSPKTSPPTTTIPVRHVTGKATTIGAGSFTGGRDVPVGRYDVTPGAGQSGNFIVSGTDSYDEIFGSGSLGVSRVRAQISAGDQIQISGLSSVTFTPTTAPLVRTHTPVTLYAGTFTVGQDVGPGRYVVTPGPGQSGNFIVNGSDSYDEILGGDASSGQVPSVTVTLTNGDSINISGLSAVALAPTR